VAVHRSVPAARLVDWVRAAAASELAIDPATLAARPGPEGATNRA
jgi:hypothetical protein